MEWTMVAGGGPSRVSKVTRCHLKRHSRDSMNILIKGKHLTGTFYMKNANLKNDYEAEPWLYHR
jgi:hypothetical protein